MTKVLAEEEVPKWVKTCRDAREQESARLDRIYNYLMDPDPSQGWSRAATWNNGPLRWLDRKVKAEVRRLAEISRVNFLPFVVNAKVQEMYVDRFRAPKSETEAPGWAIWQRNGMDARQVGIHRSCARYGVAYATVLPGDPVPVIRGASPRTLTALYGDDDDWPEVALETRRHANKGWKLYRLYDSDKVWFVEYDDNGKLIRITPTVHGLKVCPVIRYRWQRDDDCEALGIVEPFIPLQDQINVTTFGLLVTQHYSAFRQRVVIGWTSTNEQEVLKAGASTLMTFKDKPGDVDVKDLNQSDLSGFINSREASLRHLATVSQTPAHELLGQLVNLSAEALTAAERNHRSALAEAQVSVGESHEQTLGLCATAQGETVDSAAEVGWRDTEARSLAQVADALGKLVAGLGIPPQALWDRVAAVLGLSQSEVDSWKQMAKEGDAIAQLTAVIDRQSGPRAEPPGEPKPAKPASEVPGAVPVGA